MGAEPTESTHPEAPPEDLSRQLSLDLLAASISSIATDHLETLDAFLGSLFLDGPVADWEAQADRLRRERAVVTRYAHRATSAQVARDYLGHAEVVFGQQRIWKRAVHDVLRVHAIIKAELRQRRGAEQ